MDLKRLLSSPKVSYTLYYTDAPFFDYSQDFSTLYIKHENHLYTVYTFAVYPRGFR